MTASRSLAITTPTAIAERLAEHAEQARGAYASATERAVASDTATWASWCAEHGVESVPASASTVAAYVDALGHGACSDGCAACERWHVDGARRSHRWQRAKKPASVRRAVTSIAMQHRAAKVISPTSDEQVRLALRRLDRAVGTRQKQAPALRWQQARVILEAIGTDLTGLRDAALLSVATDTLARRSELVAFDVADLEVDADGSGSILIRRSKTDQAGAGSRRALLPDTVRRLQVWLAAASITSGAIFRAMKHGHVGERLDAGDVPRIVRRIAERAGLREGFTGHSTRVGAAQDLADSQFTLVEIQTAGGWKSPTMVGRYVERIDLKRAAARRAALFGRS